MPIYSNDSMLVETILYIHTNMYDAEVSKVKLWSLAKYMGLDLTGIDFISLYGIYCYKDGIIRFSFRERFGERYSLELKLNYFEDDLNKILKNYISIIKY